ncbi:hypothetical protein UlMin_017379 [Ulmus minor]
MKNNSIPPTPSCRPANNIPKEKGSEMKGAANNTKLESKPSMDINESAELFIQKFRKQLLIQRLDSIENYEQMLARGL